MVKPDNQIFDLLPGEFNLSSPQHQTEVDDGHENPCFSSVFTDLLGMVKPTVNTSCLLNEEGASVGEESLLPFPDELVVEGHSKVALHHGNGLQIPQVLPEIIRDLPQGMYKILDWIFQGDALHVTIANDSDESNPFSISIPLEQLKLSMAPKAIQAPEQNPAEQDALTVKQPKSRVDLNVSRNGAQNPVQQESFMEPGLRLEQYLSKLNLKAIEIIPAGKPTEIESPAETIRFTIIADDAGQKIVIRSYPIRKDFHLWREENPDSLKIGKDRRGTGRLATEGDNSTVKMQADPVTNPSKVLTKITPSSGNQYRFHDDFSLKNLKVAVDRNEPTSTSEKMDTYTFFEKLTSEADVVPRRLNIQPIRFTLPDNVKTALKPNGQTVMLRIEPEHLGPAKLSLSMYNDKLRARVIVNNIPAKIAVETSLHRLVEQLSRANIDVEHIEVTVGGESTYDGVFERHPQWRYHSNRFGRFNLNKGFNPGRQAAVPVSVPRSVSYVGANGVNLLA